MYEFKQVATFENPNHAYRFLCSVTDQTAMPLLDNYRISSDCFCLCVNTRNGHGYYSLNYLYADTDNPSPGYMMKCADGYWRVYLPEKKPEWTEWGRYCTFDDTDTKQYAYERVGNSIVIKVRHKNV